MNFLQFCQFLLDWNCHYQNRHDIVDKMLEIGLCLTLPLNFHVNNRRNNNVFHILHSCNIHHHHNRLNNHIFHPFEQTMNLPLLVLFPSLTNMTFFQILCIQDICFQQIFFSLVDDQLQRLLHQHQWMVSHFVVNYVYVLMLDPLYLIFSFLFLLLFQYLHLTV